MDCGQRLNELMYTDDMEMTNSVATKYYDAGGRRIAMNVGGTLSYLLGDHLGSTSITADSTGAKNFKIP